MKYKNDYQRVLKTHERKIPVILKSLVIGLVAGVIAVLYRITLGRAEHLSQIIYTYISGHMSLVVPLFLGLALVGTFIGILIRKFPLTSGSGIPQVEGQLLGYFKNPWLSTLIVKFIGGALSVFAGLSVGREGPCIQLGAAAAHGIGDKLAATRTEKKILIASGASAGLSAAFNAPLAGVMFSLEEVFRYFSPIILLATIVSAVAADLVSSSIFGLEPLFDFVIDQKIPLENYWLILILGALIGLSGALYNFTLVNAISLYKKIGNWNKHVKLIIPFIIAGILGLYFPIVLGGGEHIIEALSLSKSIQWLFLVLLIKFLFSMISFGSGAPGGIFFPLLVIGSLIGSIYGSIVISNLGVNPDLFYNFVVLAMAGFFTAIVRAPITGIILIIELTGSFSSLLPLTIVSVMAYITADLLKSAPIYESLLEIQIGGEKNERGDTDRYKKVTFETIIRHGSAFEGKKIKDMSLPYGSLVIALRRHDAEITPNGDSEILAEDTLVILTNLRDESEIREIMNKE
ncbi:MAG: ClC family H(+)/Cl(-) exchange transporter [Gudongella sp.]|nr:ClC family H(+)/Cl(-) exchange transporter [Gudongella sp.]